MRTSPALVLYSLPEVCIPPSPPVARTCHLIFIVLDVLKPLGDKAIIESELEGFGIRLNKKPPAVTVRKKDKGGIAITNTVPLTNIDHDEIKAVLSEYRINNADVAIRQAGATADDLVDVIEGNRCVLPFLLRFRKRLLRTSCSYSLVCAFSWAAEYTSPRSMS